MDSPPQGDGEHVYQKNACHFSRPNAMACRSAFERRLWELNDVRGYTGECTLGRPRPADTEGSHRRRPSGPHSGEIRDEEVMMKQLSWRLSILAAVRADDVNSGAAQVTDCTVEHPMARALRSPLMPALLLLALLWPLPGWATPIGASIALTNVLFDYDPVDKNLSAEAAAIGGLPALPLLNNGHYTDTAAGDFAVTVSLPPLGQQNLWLISADLSIDGLHVFGGQDVFGPTSITGAIDEALAQLSPFVQGIAKAIGNDLLTQPQHNGLGLLDWSYNRDPADDMTGTFALGSTLDVAQLLDIPFSLPPGEFTFSFSASAFAVDVPEPDPMLIFVPALLGLVALRWQTAQRVGNIAGSSTAGNKAARCSAL
jgi:hypothetical protein